MYLSRINANALNCSFSNIKTLVRIFSGYFFYKKECYLYHGELTDFDTGEEVNIYLDTGLNMF